MQDYKPTPNTINRPKSPDKRSVLKTLSFYSNWIRKFKGVANNYSGFGISMHTHFCKNHWTNRPQFIKKSKFRSSKYLFTSKFFLIHFISIYFSFPFYLHTHINLINRRLFVSLKEITETSSFIKTVFSDFVCVGKFIYKIIFVFHLKLNIHRVYLHLVKTSMLILSE